MSFTPQSIVSPGDVVTRETRFDAPSIAKRSINCVIEDFSADPISSSVVPRVVDEVNLQRAIAAPSPILSPTVQDAPIAKKQRVVEVLDESVNGSTSTDLSSKPVGDSVVVAGPVGDAIIRRRDDLLQKLTRYNEKRILSSSPNSLNANQMAQLWQQISPQANQFSANQVNVATAANQIDNVDGVQNSHDQKIVSTAFFPELSSIGRIPHGSVESRPVTSKTDVVARVINLRKAASDAEEPKTAAIVLPLDSRRNEPLSAQQRLLSRGSDDNNRDVKASGDKSRASTYFNDRSDSSGIDNRGRSEDRNGRNSFGNRIKNGDGHFSRSSSLALAVLRDRQDTARRSEDRSSTTTTGAAGARSYRSQNRPAALVSDRRNNSSKRDRSRSEDSDYRNDHRRGNQQSSSDYHYRSRSTAPIRSTSSFKRSYSRDRAVNRGRSRSRSRSKFFKNDSRYCHQRSSSRDEYHKSSRAVNHSDYQRDRSRSYDRSSAGNGSDYRQLTVATSSSNNYYDPNRDNSRSSALLDSKKAAAAATEANKSVQMLSREEFLATYKVKKCPNQHGCNFSEYTCFDWHSKAMRRRNPFEANYKPNLCFDSADTCRYGDNCERAHNKTELFFHPLRFRRLKCDKVGTCPHGKYCAFIHDSNDDVYAVAGPGAVVTGTGARAIDVDPEVAQDSRRTTSSGSVRMIHNTNGAAAEQVATKLMAAESSSLNVVSSAAVVAAPVSKNYVSCNEKMRKVHVDFMSTFKVIKCADPREHDTKQCWNWHTIADRRRNPFATTYECSLCPVAAECAEEESCNKAHSSLEVFFHPELFKTSLCQFGAEFCERGDLCPFAHSEEDRRVIAALPVLPATPVLTQTHRQSSTTIGNDVAVSSVDDVIVNAIEASNRSVGNDYSRLSGTSKPDDVVEDEVQDRNETRFGTNDATLDAQHQQVMETYKTIECSQRHNAGHARRFCPHWHTDIERRRNPFVYSYLPEHCLRQRDCRLGDDCCYSHSKFEALFHPRRYKTSVCNNNENCPRGIRCAYTHSASELRRAMRTSSAAVAVTVAAPVNISNSSSSRSDAQAHIDTTAVAAVAEDRKYKHPMQDTTNSLRPNLVQHSELLLQVQQRLVQIVKAAGPEGVLSATLPVLYAKKFKQKMPSFDEQGRVYKLRALLQSLPIADNGLQPGEDYTYSYINSSSDGFETRAIRWKNAAMKAARSDDDQAYDKQQQRLVLGTRVILKTDLEPTTQHSTAVEVPLKLQDSPDEVDSTVGRFRSYSPSVGSSHGGADEELLEDRIEFLSTFKVHRCNCPGSHDHFTCQYWHSTSDRRRNPFKVIYSAGRCEEGGNCPHGEFCCRTHNSLESDFHPERYKTALCRVAFTCGKGHLCTFAHSNEERRIHTAAAKEFQKDRDRRRLLRSEADSRSSISRSSIDMITSSLSSKR